MITSLDDRNSVRRCIQISANDYLVKPVRIAMLRQRIEALIQEDNDEK